jgi:O-antigen biosynthesis protein
VSTVHHEDAATRSPIATFETFVGEPDAEVANARLATTEASHWIFIRDGSAVRDVESILARVVAELPDAAIIYGDSHDPGRLRKFAPRPVHSPLRLRQQDYLGPVVALRVESLRELGGFRADADGAQVLDLALRLHESLLARVPAVLGIGAPIALPEQPDAAERASEVVRRHLAELGITATVSATEHGRRTVTYPIADTPLVSIVIPTRGGSGVVAGRDRAFVVEAVRGILERSTYPNIEFVVVADDATPQHVIDELEHIAGTALRLVRWSSAFNFSAKMNRGALVAAGEYLLLLNDDIELVSADWIEQMLGLAEQPGIGMVGALLYFEDGTLQHAGHLYEGGAAGHIGFGAIPGVPAVLDTFEVDREVSGVTAACALIRTETFRAVGGFSLQFPGNYNDVDLCFKVRGLGLSIVCASRAHLYHFESRTRDARIAPSELQAIHTRWFDKMQVDAYWRDPRDRGF